MMYMNKVHGRFILSNKRITYETEVDKKAVGKRIKKIRTDKEMTMEELGKKLGKGLEASKGAVYNWERGSNLPNKERLKSIAKIGNISLNELLHGKDLVLEKLSDSFYKVLDEFKREVESSSFRGKIAGRFLNIEFNHKSFTFDLDKEECNAIINEVYSIYNNHSSVVKLTVIANSPLPFKDEFKRKILDKFIKENDSSDVLQIIETIKKLDELYDSLNNFGYAEHFNKETGEWEKEIHANINRKHNTDLRNMVYNSIKSTLKIGKEHKVISSYELIERG